MAHLCGGEARYIPGTFCQLKCKVRMDEFVEMLALRVIPNIPNTRGDLDTIAR